MAAQLRSKQADSEARKVRDTQVDLYRLLLLIRSAATVYQWSVEAEEEEKKREGVFTCLSMPTLRSSMFSPRIRSILCGYVSRFISTPNSRFWDLLLWNITDVARPRVLCKKIVSDQFYSHCILSIGTLRDPIFCGFKILNLGNGIPFDPQIICWFPRRPSESTCFTPLHAHFASPQLHM